MAGIFPKELFFFLRSMGLFPVTSVSVEGAEQLKFALPVYIYSLCLVASQTFLSTCSWLWNMQHSFDFLPNSTGNTVVSVMFCDVLTLAVSAIISILSSGFNCSRLIVLYCEMQRVDDTLKVKPNNSHLRWWLFVSLTYLTTVLTLDYLTRNYVEYTSQSAVSLLHLSLLSLHYTDLAVQLQYTSVVHSIYQRFRLINQHIKDEVTSYRFRNIIKPTVIPTIETIKGVPGMGLGESTKGRSVGVRTLSDLHWLLCGAVHRTNTVFSWPLLAHMLSLFLHVIIAPYFFFFQVNMLSLSSMDHYHYGPLIAMQIVWVLTHASKLVLLVWPCSLATNEASRTAPIVCKLLNCEMSSDIRKQLETFVLQLLHHDAEFTAFGLFPLQFPILTSIAGAVTTYLVILIQFQNADSMEKNSEATKILLKNSSLFQS